MTYRSYLRHAAVAAGLLLAVGACVDTPAGSDPGARAGGPDLGRVKSSEENLFIVPQSLEPVARYIKKPHAQDYWIKQWIGPAGGTVDFLGFRIVVPPGAVTRVTKFEIRIPGENSPQHQDEYAMAEFRPHNVTFRVPVRLELPYRNTTAFGGAAGVLWYDEHARDWVEVGGGITADGERVYVDVPHFSTYGTQQERADGGGTSTPTGGRASY